MKLFKRILTFILSLTILLSTLTLSSTPVFAQEPTAFEKAFSEQVLVEAQKMMGRVRYGLGSKWHSSGTGYSLNYLTTECNGYVRRILVNTVYALESQGYIVPNEYKGLKNVVPDGLEMRGHLQNINRSQTGSTQINVPSNMQYPNGNPNMNVIGKWLEENIGVGSVVFFEQRSGNMHWGIYAGKDKNTGKHMVYHNTGQNNGRVNYTGAKYDTFETMWFGKSGGGAYSFSRVYKTTPVMPDTGDALLKKTDTSGNPIQGARFTLYRSNKTTPTKHVNITTNSKGEIVFSDLEAGTYYAKETYVPSPYIVDSNTWWRFDVKEGQTVTVSNGTSGTIRNQTAMGRIEINKRNTSDDPLQGVIYEVRNSSNTLVDTVTTSSNGKATTKTLPLGKYTVIEKSVPSPYVLDEKPINVELKYKNQTTPVVTASVSQTNKEATGRVEVHKKDDKGNNVEGTVYEIRNASNVLVDTITTAFNGKALSKELPLGKYTVVEKSVPTPYILDPTPMSVELKYRNQNTPVITASVSQTNKEATGKIEIIKQSETYGNGLKNTISNATFDIINSSGNVVDTVTTSSNGKITSKELPLGKYTVVEKSVPTPYILDPRPVEVEVLYKDNITPLVIASKNITNTFKPIIRLGVERIRIDTQKASEGLDVEVLYDKVQNYDWDVNDFQNTQIKVTLKDTTNNKTILTKNYTAKNFPKEEIFKVPSSFLSVDGSANYEISLSLVNPNQSNQVEIYKSSLDTYGYTASETFFDQYVTQGIDVDVEYVIRTQRVYGQAMQTWNERFEISVPRYDRLRAGRGYDYKAIVKYSNDLNQDTDMSFVLTSMNELVDGDWYDRGSTYTKIPLTLNEEGIYTVPRVYAKRDIRGDVISEETYLSLSNTEKTKYRDGGNQVLTPMWSTDVGVYDLFLESNEIGVNKFKVKLKDSIEIFAYMYGWLHPDGASPTIDLDETIVTPISTSDLNNNNIPDIWESNLMPDNWGVKLPSGEKILTSVEKQFFGLSGELTLSYELDGGTMHRNFASVEVELGEYKITETIPERNDYTFIGWLNLADGTLYQPDAVIDIKGETVLKAQWEYNAVLDIQTKNTENEFLGNVTFEISKDKNTVISTSTTDSNGVVTIEDLAVGNYFIRVTSVPVPYVIKTSWEALRIEEGQPSKHTMVVDKAKGQITVKDNDPTKLGKYKIFDKDGIEIVEIMSNESIVLPLGKYTISQIEINSPYIRDYEHKAFELKYVDANTTLFTTTVHFNNQRTYAVTFDTSGGSTIPSQTVREGNKITIPTNPTREGHTFTGWNGDLTQAITSDTTFVAEWVPNTYTVVFENYDGTVLDTQEIAYGGVAFAPTSPIREGYTFIGWNQEFEQITKDLVVTAQYKINEYTVTFVDEDGTVLKEETVSHFNSATPPSDPNNEGYEFTGWSEPFNSITSDLVVIAEYKIKEYAVMFKDHDGEIIEIQIVHHGQGLTPPNDPERKGFTFIEWDQSLENIIRDMVVTPIYERNTYKVIYLQHDDDEGHDTEIYERLYEDSFVLEEITPSRDGKFLGWLNTYDETLYQKGDTIAVNGDTWLIGQWEYTVDFVDEDMSLIHRKNLMHGEEITMPEDPAKVGYEFMGWEKISETEHEHDENCCVDDEGNPISEYRITQNTVYQARWEKTHNFTDQDLFTYSYVGAGEFALTGFNQEYIDVVLGGVKPTKITVPETYSLSGSGGYSSPVTSIGSYAFAMHSTLSEIVIPNSIKTISTSAFVYSGTAVEKVVIYANLLEGDIESPLTLRGHTFGQAKWERKPLDHYHPEGTFLITFNPHNSEWDPALNAEEFPPIIVPEGESFTIPSVRPIYELPTFDHWEIKNSSKRYNPGDIITPTEDMEFEAYTIMR